MEAKRKTLRELVAEKQIFAPCVWDLMSQRAAEMAGFEATLLSGGALAEWACGMPDIGLITSDDLVRAIGYIAEVNDLPCCVDADDGYGETPTHAWRTTTRLVAAGASAFTLDDTTGYRGYNRWGDGFNRLLSGFDVENALYGGVPDAIRAEDRSVPDPALILCAIGSGDVREIGSLLFNDFESVYGRDERYDLCKNAAGVCLTGSGSAVFAVFADSRECRAAQKALERSGFRTYSCKTV